MTMVLVSEQYSNGIKIGGLYHMSAGSGAATCAALFKHKFTGRMR